MDKKIKLLSSLCSAVVFMGWALVVGGWCWLLFYFSSSNIGVLSDREIIQIVLYGVSAVSFDFFFVGLGAVVAAGLIKFAIEKESKPALMLRCGDKIFYSFAVLGVVWAFFRHFIFIATIENITARFIYEQPILLPTLAKAIILILLGQILKRLLPAIQEYKTLV